MLLFQAGLRTEALLIHTEIQLSGHLTALDRWFLPVVFAQIGYSLLDTKVFYKFILLLLNLQKWFILDAIPGRKKPNTF